MDLESKLEGLLPNMRQDIADARQHPDVYRDIRAFTWRVMWRWVNWLYDSDIERRKALACLENSTCPENRAWRDAAPKPPPWVALAPNLDCSGISFYFDTDRPAPTAKSYWAELALPHATTQIFADVLYGDKGGAAQALKQGDTARRRALERVAGRSARANDPAAERFYVEQVVAAHTKGLVEYEKELRRLGRLKE